METSMLKIICVIGSDNGWMKRHASDVCAELGAVLCRWPELRSDGEPLPVAAHGDCADEIVAQFSRAPQSHRVAVILTHSDAFLLRLRRRIAEGSLPADALEVRNVSADGREVTVIPFDDRGVPAGWPKGWGAEPLAEFQAMRRVLVEQGRGVS